MLGGAHGVGGLPEPVRLRGATTKVAAEAVGCRHPEAARGASGIQTALAAPLGKHEQVSGFQ